MPTTQLGISLKPTCLIILLFLNGKEWPEVSGEKREPAMGKWAKGFNRVINKKKAVMTSPALRGRVISFLIPQTVTKKAPGGVQTLPADSHKLAIVTVGDGAKPATSSLLTAGENVPASPCGDGRAPYRKAGEHLPHDSIDAIAEETYFPAVPPPLDQLTGIRGRMCKLCHSLLKKAGGPLQGIRLVQNLLKSPVLCLLPT